MPIFIPIVVLSLEPQFYVNKSKSQCWLIGPPLYILYIIPITIMLLVNVGFMIASLINILKKPIHYYDKTRYRLNQILLSILNSFLMCMTWLVSYSLVHEFNNNSDTVTFEVIFCIGLVIHGHFIFLFHIYFCKSKKSLLFQNNAKHKLNTLLNLVNNKNEKDKISSLKYRSQNVFTIPVQMDNFTIKPRPTIMTCYDTNSNNANFHSFDSNINSLSYLYTNSNKNRIKKKFLSSKSSLASSLSFLSNKRKQLCNRFYKRRNRIDENINKRYLGTYNNTNNNNNDVPSRINRLNDSFKRIKYKTRKSKLIQNPFDFSSIISQSNSTPSQNNSPINSRINNERTLFIKSNSFKLTHHLPDSLFLE